MESKLYGDYIYNTYNIPTSQNLWDKIYSDTYTICGDSSIVYDNSSTVYSDSNWYTTIPSTLNDDIERLEEEIRNLTDILKTLVLGMKNSNFKIAEYQNMLEICSDKLVVLVDKKEKPKKSREDFLSDKDFEL